MKVTYLVTIVTPFKKAGEKGVTKKVPDAIAKVLIAEGHVKLAENKEIVDDVIEQGPDIKS